MEIDLNMFIAFHFSCCLMHAAFISINLLVHCFCADHVFFLSFHVVSHQNNLHAASYGVSRLGCLSHHWPLPIHPGYASGSVFHPAVCHPQTSTKGAGHQGALLSFVPRPGNSISIADLTEVFQLLGSGHSDHRCRSFLEFFVTKWVFSISNLTWDSKCEERAYCVCCTETDHTLKIQHFTHCGSSLMLFSPKSQNHAWISTWTREVPQLANHGFRADLNTAKLASRRRRRRRGILGLSFSSAPSREARKVGISSLPQALYSHVLPFFKQLFRLGSLTNDVAQTV